MHRVTYGYTGKHGAIQSHIRLHRVIHMATQDYKILPTKNQSKVSMHFYSVVTTSSPTNCVNNLWRTFPTLLGIDGDLNEVTRLL